MIVRIVDQEQARPAEAITLGPGKGRQLRLGPSSICVLVTAERAIGATLVEFTAAPGFDTGLHLHRRLEEQFYVTTGQIQLRIGNQTTLTRPGGYAFVPPGVPHGFANPGQEPASLLLVMSPPGHERYFEELAGILGAGGRPDTDAIAALRRRYDTEQLSALVSGRE